MNDKAKQVAQGEIDAALTERATQHFRMEESGLDAEEAAMVVESYVKFAKSELAAQSAELAAVTAERDELLRKVAILGKAVRDAKLEELRKIYTSIRGVTEQVEAGFRFIDWRLLVEEWLEKECSDVAQAAQKAVKGRRG